MKLLIIGLASFLTFASLSEAEEFTNLKSAIVAGTIAHIKKHPPKGFFTIALGYNYQFENARDVPEEIIKMVLSELPPEQVERHIPFNKFPAKQKFPVLEAAPKTKIEFYYMGGFEYIDDTEIEVMVGYSWERLKFHKNSYSVKRVDGNWRAASTAFYF